MSLTGLQSAIVTSIDTTITTLRTVQQHGGRFDAQELRRYALRAPAALVACLGGPISRDVASHSSCKAKIAVFVVTHGNSAVARNTDALTFCESIAGMAALNTWDYVDAQAPLDIRIDNLYGSSIDETGSALWAVTWTQASDIDVYDDSALDEFHTANTKWDLWPADGTIDAEDLLLIWGQFMSAYGHIYVSSAAATSVATPGTYVKAAGTTTLKLADEFDMPADMRIRHTGTPTRPTLVTASCSVTVASDCKVTVALAENGVLDANTAQEQELTAAGGAMSFDVKGVLSLAENDYAEVWVTADEIVGVTMTKLNFVAAAT